MTDSKNPTQMDIEDLFREFELNSMKIEANNCTPINYEIVDPILKMNHDNLSPSHYKLPSGLEVKDIMKDVMGVENVKQFYKGNIIKYVLRADKKNGIEDYKKAKRYIEMLEELEE